MWLLIDLDEEFLNEFEFRLQALKEVDKITYNTMLADSTLLQECYKTGETCKYGCSGLCRDSY